MTLLEKFNQDQFANLVADAQVCSQCSEMAGCNRVLTDANGNPSARIMFVGEAPGRLGAERTAIPFHGDAAGENFDRLLRLAGFSRRDIFVTNAVLCNPTDEHGNNRPPSVKNLKNCAELLERQIQTINPEIIVTLGAKALQALNYISEHNLQISTSVRTMNNWFGRTLVPLYHPGARAMIHRNFPTQTADYYFLSEQFKRYNQAKKIRGQSAPKDRSGWEVVEYLLSKLGSASLFRLHKILYLLDYRSQIEDDHPITDFFYIRQKDGPYCVELGTKWYRDFDYADLKFVQGKPFVNWQNLGLFDQPISIEQETKRKIDQWLEPLEKLSDAQLKTRAYLTRPMKAALRAEKQGLRGLNRALL
ncbi:uracil-DNA glycosylase family protein [Altererythrobacter aquiaggeris]|uniref:uracil-DNA glycosylase family protein n=1 Tax=Aestuarierythrobacter aquiaggeris TaxID=1898396 RepID=UPI00301661EE